jgi:hypothetical protein
MNAPIAFFSRCALTICAGMAMLYGCAGPESPMDVPGALPQGRPGHEKSWMAPDAKNIKKLLYVSDGNDTVYVFNYKTEALVGKLTGENGLSQGQCVDKLGDVWLIEYGNIDGVLGSAVEYAHGGSTPLKTLSTEGTSVGCSIDPTSGDLAVANGSNAGSGPPNVAVFKNASGTPKLYYNYYCGTPLPPGYDQKGDLYVEGDEGGSGLSNPVCVLPRQGKALRPVRINVRIPIPEGVMWDGKYITLATEVGVDPKTAIYQMAKNSSGDLKKVGQTVLTDSCYGDRAEVRQPFIVGSANTPANKQQGNVVVGGNMPCVPRFDYWTYPAGGNPIEAFLVPFGGSSQSVSIAPTNDAAGVPLH